MSDYSHWGEQSQRFVTSAIPELPGMLDVNGRRTIAIKDCGEPLVRLNDYAPEVVAVSPQYAIKNYKTASHDVWARAGVAAMLVAAGKLLPQPLRLLVWDAWRPTDLQAELFEEELQKQRATHPGYTQEELIRETQKFVSFPSTDAATPAPHLTGGAVDLTICDAALMPIETGTAFDDFTARAATRYLEEQRMVRKLSQRDETALHHRRLLYGVMTAAGFTGYREEWWHYDYGDQFWAYTRQTTSIYAGCGRAR